MKITVKQAIGSVQALGYLTTTVSFEQGVGMAFGMALKQVRSANEVYEDERVKLVKKFAKKDADGKIVKLPGQGGEQAAFDEDGQEAFNEARKALLAQEISIAVEPVRASALGEEKLMAFIYADLDWLIVPDNLSVYTPSGADAAKP